MTFMELVNKVDTMSFGLGILFCMFMDIVFSFINWMIEKGRKEREKE